MSAPDRRSRLDRGHERLSVRRQCALLGLARSGVYRAPPPTREDDAAAMRRIDALYTDCPFYGSRRIAFELKMSRKRVQRLMRLMGIAALEPKPRTSKPAPGHKYDRAASQGAQGDARSVLGRPFGVEIVDRAARQRLRRLHLYVVMHVIVRARRERPERQQVVGYIKGKSAIHLARVYGERKRNFVGQHFGPRDSSSTRSVATRTRSALTSATKRRKIRGSNRR
jgi:hypothetical protein